jgi:hypothetical protein
MRVLAGRWPTLLAEAGLSRYGEGREHVAEEKKRHAR